MNMGKQSLLGLYPGSMTDVQAEKVRNLINTDDQFRRAWQNSSPSLGQPPQNQGQPYSYQSDVASFAKTVGKSIKEVHRDRMREWERVMSGERDTATLRDVEKIDLDEFDRIASGQHPRQRLIEDLPTFTRFKQLLAGMPDRQLSAKQSELQQILLQRDPEFRKAYQAQDPSLISVKPPTFEPEQTGKRD